MSAQGGQSEEIKCLSELHRYVRDKDVMNSLAEMFFKAVYDSDKKECRNFSVLDRVATAISRHAVKVALFDLKRGLASEAKMKVTEEALQALDVAERCLDASERDALEALHFLRTVVLNALSRCIKASS